MTCGPVPTTFRILDRDARWELDLVADPGAVPGAVPGAAIGGAIELALCDPAAVDPGALARALPPPWFARGCDACTWYVLAPPDPGPPALLRLTPCAGTVAAIACHVALVAPVAVAATAGHVAVLDPGRGELLILSPGGDRVILDIPCQAHGPIAFAGRSILVANGPALTAYPLVGGAPRPLAPAPGPIARLAVAGGAIWAAIEIANGADHDLALVRYRAPAEPSGWHPASLAELIANARDTGIAALGADTVCVEVPRDGMDPCIVCVDRRGRPTPAPPPVAGPHRALSGTVSTRVRIDSGIPRCRWHRVRIELELPERTGLEISLATVEKPDDPIAALDWQIADAGPLTPAPTHGAHGAICDFLIDQPPGRYLALRLALRGDGTATPRIRRIRLDFPRSTSAERLPGVYREDPLSAGFLERFVALFDASIEDLDRVIERFPALIDPAAAPTEALPWLGTFLDIALDPAWPEATRRAILAEAPALYRARGTPRALVRAIELVTGLTPAIQELGGTARTFGLLSAGARTARLGEVRLFGRSRTRLRLGSSALGSAPLHSYGDPDRDHVAALGWRIAIQVPDDPGMTPEAVARLRRLIDAQKPAHVVASVRVGAGRGLVGIEYAVGIDTRLGGLPASHLGTTTLLGRRTVLAPGARRGGAGFAVGTASAIAIQTHLS